MFWNEIGSLEALAYLKISDAWRERDKEISSLKEKIDELKGLAFELSYYAKNYCLITEKAEVKELTDKLESL